LDDFASFVDEEFGEEGPFTNDFVLGAVNTTEADIDLNSTDVTGGTGVDGAGDSADIPTGTSVSDGDEEADDSVADDLATAESADSSEVVETVASGTRSAGEETEATGTAPRQRSSGVLMRPRTAAAKDPKQAARNMARTGNENDKPEKSPSAAMISFGELVNATIAEGPAAAQLFFLTPEGQALLERATTGPLADLIDGSVKQLAGATGKVIQDLLKPGQELVKAASNLTGTIAANSTNLLTKALVQMLEVGEPLVKLGAEMQKNITGAIRSNSDRMKDKAGGAYEQLSKEVEAMPEGPAKEQMKEVLKEQGERMAKSEEEMKVKKAEGEPQMGH
jgi:hypothetical protein